MRDHAGGAEEFNRINTQGTLHLAHAAAAAGVRRFVFISTIKVNGDMTAGRAFAAHDAPVASDGYSRSKLEAETALRALPGLESVVIRPPLIHGPGAKGNLERFCRLAAAGLPVPLAGIHNRRDLVGVDNLCNLIERCLWHAAAPQQVFLAADGEPLSTTRLYELIAEGVGRSARMFPLPPGLLRVIARPLGMGGEIDRLTQSLEVDIAKTRDLLAWSPPVSAAEGVLRMARAYARGTGQ
jgi:nucleoside-diphosphate-sugar epimerase